jgi:hypothetical protein
VANTTCEAILKHDLTAPQWRRSSHSSTNGGECVEVAAVRGRVSVRDSKNPDGTVLRFAPTEWRSFLEHIKRSASEK